MKEIQLTQGKIAIVDDDDFERLNQFGLWQALKAHHTFYATSRAKNHLHPNRRRTIFMHRIIMGDPLGQVDHKDGNGLNNCRSNLRIATSSQNHQNKKSVPRTSIYKGVFWDRCRWQSTITTPKGFMRLGRFISEVEAALAYDTAARLHFGEFARLNFPSSDESSAVSTPLDTIILAEAVDRSLRISRRLRIVRTDDSCAISIWKFPDMSLWLRFRALCLPERRPIGEKLAEIIRVALKEG